MSLQADSDKTEEMTTSEVATPATSAATVPRIAVIRRTVSIATAETHNATRYQQGSYASWKVLELWGGGNFQDMESPGK